MARLSRAAEEEEGDLSLPVGFRFRPTDEELVNYYLKNKLEGSHAENIIDEIDILKFEPWDLPGKMDGTEQTPNYYLKCKKLIKDGSRFKMKISQSQWNLEKDGWNRADSKFVLEMQKTDQRWIKIQDEDQPIPMESGKEESRSKQSGTVKTPFVYSCFSAARVKFG
ncbi:protein NTM1-like 9 [Prunus avium]|uniref:Protein NTM1-like 9 n=1 Tax=Prunus avium TaxID=42229 RepID=A0A6P5T623_PRUAV|nr:protein NTM1-like 9 [Prunus avium]